MEQKREFFEGIDGLRAIAAMWVLFFHFYYFADSPSFSGSFLVRAGWVGVDIFFVISGFVLSLPLLTKLMNGQKYSIGNFYRKRIMRIVPAYYFSLFVFITFFHTELFTDPRIFMHILGHLTFTEGFIIQTERLHINGVYWTLWIEMQFYIILPLLILLFKGKKWWLSLVSIVVLVTLYKYVGIVMTEGLSDSNKFKQFYINMQLPGVLQEFAMGIGVAVFYLKIKSKDIWNKNRNLFSLLVIPGFILILICMKFIIVYGSTKYWFGKGSFGYLPLLSLNTIISIGAALILIGIISQATWIKKIFGNPIMNFIGTISFGIYIWHYPVGKYMAQSTNLGKFETFIILCLFGTLMTIAWAYLSYKFIEKPFLIKKEKTSIDNNGEREKVQIGA